jgi:hypothetical protein
MRLFMSVRGKGAVPHVRKVLALPEFPCKMVVKLFGKMPVFGKKEIEIECENPLTINELSEEIEAISEQFFNEMNDSIERFTLECELSGRYADAYRMKNTIPSFGYDVFEVAGL